MKFLPNFYLIIALILPDNGLLAERFPEKTQAAIVNAAVGDALGRVTEFINITDKIHHKFGPQGVTKLDQAKILHLNQSLVPYTDDTVMLLIVLRKTLEGRKNGSSTDLITHNIALNFLDLFGENKYKVDPLCDLRAHGPTNIIRCRALTKFIAQEKISKIFQEDKTIQAWVSHSVAKTDFHEIQKEGGCGSVMRAWSIGLIYSDNITLAKKLAVEQSRITHRHPMALAACAAMTVGVAYAYQGKSTEEIVKGMIKAAEEFENDELLYKKQARKLTFHEIPTKAMLADGALLTSDMIRYAYESAKNGKKPDEILGMPCTPSSEHFLSGSKADRSIAAAVYLLASCPDSFDAATKATFGRTNNSAILSLAGALIGAKTGVAPKKEILQSLESRYSFSAQIDCLQSDHKRGVISAVK